MNAVTILLLIFLWPVVWAMFRLALSFAKWCVVAFLLVGTYAYMVGY